MIKKILSELKIKTRINQRAGIFIACLIISICFWFVTSMSRVYESAIVLPVTYKNLPITQQIDESLPSTVKFRFKGTGFELFALHMRSFPDSLIADISLTQSQNSDIRFPTSILVKQLGKKISPLEIIPQYISPVFTKRMGKKVAVKLDASINFRDRYGLATKVVLRPDSLEIAGPDSILEKIDFIWTEKISLNDIHQEYFGGVNLKTNSFPPSLKISQPYIHFLVPTVEYTEGTVEVPVQLPLSYQNQFTLLPAKVSVSYLVELEKYARIKPEDFAVTVVLPQPGEMPPSLQSKLLRQPVGVRNVKINPAFINYLIRK